MHRIHLLIQAVLVFLLSSTSWAGHSMVPCNYIFDKAEPIKTGEKIFDSLVDTKINRVQKDILAYLKFAPSFEPEVVFTIQSKGSEFLIQRHTASDNIFGSIQVVAHQNKIDINKIPQNIDMVGKLLNESITFTTVEKRIHKELAMHILDNFNFQLANSRNPTEAEAMQIFNLLDGYSFFFKSPSGTCFMGLHTMLPPAKQLMDIVMLLTELFDSTGEESKEVTRKIMSIKH